MRFSIIVPIYGVEPYLDACVQSLLAQTFQDFEIILVDDKSPDACPAICDRWAQKDARIRVIHKAKNEGLGFARNTGMQACNGEYLLFVDSDDELVPHALDTCQAALEDETEILVFGTKLKYENEKGTVERTEILVPEDGKCHDKVGKAALFSALSRRRVFNYAWNKIYKRQFLLDCNAAFESTPLIEDFLFNIHLFAFVNHVKTISAPLYLYRKPAHETLASRYNPAFFELSKRKFELEKQFLLSCDSYCGAYKATALQGYIKHVFSAVLRNRSHASGMGFSEQREAVRRMLCDEVTKEVIAAYKPQELPFKMLLLLLKLHSATLILAFSGLLDWAQKRLPQCK